MRKRRSRARAALMRAASRRRWDRLNTFAPSLLHMKVNGWHKLGSDVQRLVLKLARSQGCRCFFCDQSTGLYIDHAHFPGRYQKKTIYNVRGLLCSRCNPNISYHDQEEDRSFKNFENADGTISADQREYYLHLFYDRLIDQFEEDTEQALGPHRYNDRLLRWSIIRLWREFPNRRQRECINWASKRRLC